MNSEEKKHASIEFFGEVDRKGHRMDGLITSDYPAWYFDSQIEELEIGIEDKERALKMGYIHPTEVEITKRNLANEKDRLQKILESKPRLKATQKDRLSSVRNELGEEIRNTMFTRDEMEKGFASAHEEVRRQTNYFIKVDPELASSLNVRHEKGRVTREGAARIWKITGKLLGEETNVETLRRSYKHGTYRSDVPLEEVERS
jgi:hypothetical protein